MENAATEIPVREFSCYTYREVRTAGGQLLELTCDPKEAEEIATFLATKVRTLKEPVTKQTVNVEHGGYGRYTRYAITQHKYGGGNSESGEGGYIEVLEIKDPPRRKWDLERCGIVIHTYTTWAGSVFYEFCTLEDALAAYERCWGAHDRDDSLRKAKGCQRAVPCGMMRPWFYAVADELLYEDDFVFPHSVHAVDGFLPLRRYVVEDERGHAEIKTCITAYRRHREGWGDAQGPVLVTWSDGTTWDGSYSRRRPWALEYDQYWICEIMKEFAAFLSGTQTRFVTEFRDGSRFIGRWVPPAENAKTAKQRYHVKCSVEKDGKIKTQQGIYDFVPTPELPSIEQSLEVDAKAKGYKILKIISITIKKKRNVWKGVFEAPSKLRPVAYDKR